MTVDRDILGNDRRLVDILRRLPDVAVSDAPVVIEGESGTGKELLARRVHALSRRSAGPFVPLNCGAIPDSLLDSELFGHEKGAFTGATAKRAGRLELAAGGTLFLDEIGEMPADMQVRLLRVLQEGEFMRVGGRREEALDVRVVAATNRSLEALVADGTFREDLFYRLSVFTVHLPPLRARVDDIVLLSRHFVREYGAQLQKQVVGLTPQATEYLQRYTYPGNVRELQNIVQRAVVLCRGDMIDVADLPTRVRRNVEVDGSRRISIDVPRNGAELKVAKEEARRQVSEQVERAFLRRLLTEFRGNVSRAAEAAGMNRTQLHQMIRRCGVQPEHFRGYDGPEDGKIERVRLPEEPVVGLSELS